MGWKTITTINKLPLNKYIVIKAKDGSMYLGYIYKTRTNKLLFESGYIEFDRNDFKYLNFKQYLILPK